MSPGLSHCYQTCLTIRGTSAKGWGETLCGEVLDRFRISHNRDELITPLDAIADPCSVTCLECHLLIPELKRQCEEHDGVVFR